MRKLVHYTEQWLVELIHHSAHRLGVPPRPLELLALLHLPRLADLEGSVDTSVAAKEIERLATTLPLHPEWLVERAVPAAGRLTMTQITESLARVICERFHYLRSHRTSGEYYGAFTDSASIRPVAIAATTRVDVATLADLVRPPIPQSGARVVARVFGFIGVPKNTISRLLGFVVREETQLLNTKQFLTYVNPNLGFSGTSYVASGWNLVGQESGVRYRYLDDNYITDRELERRFGTFDADQLRRILGNRFAYSKMALKPLLVFSRIA